MRTAHYHLDPAFVDAVRRRAKADWRTIRCASDLGQVPWLAFPEIAATTGPRHVIITRTSSRLRRLAKAIGYAGPIRGEAVDR